MLPLIGPNSHYQHDLNAVHVLQLIISISLNENLVLERSYCGTETCTMT